MSRRRKPTPQSEFIWEQLERIERAYHLAHGRREDAVEARTEWEKLWQETVAGDRLGTVPIDDAGAILLWGWVLAMTVGKYDIASDRLSAYFTHPEIERANSVSKTELRGRLATGILYSGNEEKALGIYRSLLQSEEKTARIALMVIRNLLLGFCWERNGSESASGALRDLVEEIANRYRRRVPCKKRLPENATYADLQRLLDSTYPPSGRAALQEERESRNESRAG